MSHRYIYLSYSYCQLCNTLLTAIQYIPNKKTIQPILILVPHTILKNRLKKWLTEELEGLVAIHILTISELANIVCIACDQTMRRALYPELEIILWQCLIEQQTLPTEYWKNSQTLPGFAPAIQNFFFELKSSGITFQQFHEIAVSLNLPKLIELSNLLFNYQQQLNTQGIHDEQDQILRAIGFLEENHTWQNYPMIVFGFWKWSWCEQKFLKKWIQNQFVYIFFSQPNNPLQFPNFFHKQLQWLEALDFEKISIGNVTSSHIDKKDNSAGLFASRLFYENIGDTFGKLPKQEVDLEICCPLDIHQEVEYVAKRILEQISKGISLSQIAVIIIPDSMYHIYLQNIFQRLHISYYDTHSNCSNTPQALLISEIFELAKTQGKAEVLQNLWHSPQLNISYILANESNRWVFDWDILSSQLGMPKSWEIWQQKLEKYIIRLKENGDESIIHEQEIQIASALVKFIVFWQNTYTTLTKIKNYQTLRQQFQKLFEQIIYPSPIRDAILPRLALLDQLDRFRIPATLDKMARAIHSIIDSTPLPNTEFWYKGVFLGSLDEVFGLAFDVVIIPGMMEKEMPQAPYQNPLLSDADRNTISEALNKYSLTLPNNREQICEQKLQYYMAVVNAKHIFLSWPQREAMSEQGKLPCPFLLETATAVEGRKIHFSTLDSCDIFQLPQANWAWNREPQSTLFNRDYMLALSQKALSGDHQAWAFLISYYPILDTAYHQLQIRWQSPYFSCYDGILHNTERYCPTNKQPISIEFMEDYADCPLKFFFRHILQCKRVPQKRLIPTPQTPEQHRLLVKILQHYFEIRKTSQITTYDQIANLLKTAAQINVGPRNSPEEQILWEIMRDQVVEYLEYYLKTSEEVAPIYFNLNYLRSKDKPVILELGEGQQILWAGQLDQINQLDEQHAVAIRYKFNPSSFKEKDNSLRQGRHLELAIDLLALSQLQSDFIPFSSISYILRPTHHPEKIYFTQLCWEDTQQKLIQICHLIANSIKQGYFFPNPETWKCLYCPYYLICGPMNQTLSAFKQKDNCMELYRQLQTIN